MNTRTNTQCTKILTLLSRGGKVSNTALSIVALKYTSRISDLRARGHVIECIRGVGGVTYYRLG